MTRRYFVWMVPPALMAVAAMCALGFWGDPVEDGNGGVFIDFAFGDRAASLAEENRPGLPIRIGMDTTTYALMNRMENRKVYKDRAVNVTLTFGDDGAVRRNGVVTLRGRGSLRKEGSLPNYDVKLIRPLMLAEGVEVSRFFLMNLAYDPYHMELATSYRLLRELGLFPLHFQFVQLEVAGRNHGIYLLVEPPVAGLRRTQSECVSVFRRVRPNGYDVEWAASVPAVRASLGRLRALVRQPPDQRLKADLGQALNLGDYFRWLAVNALLRNADTLDEVFLYELRSHGGSPSSLRVMGWDYDDIIHAMRKEDALEDPLLFGCVDPLERRVAGDAELYEAYGVVVREMLQNALAMDRIEKLIREVQTLRNGLDDGTSEQNQRRARKHRDVYVERMISQIQVSHRKLSDLVDPST